jgi:hypothetical protein
MAYVRLAVTSHTADGAITSGDGTPFTRVVTRMDVKVFEGCSALARVVLTGETLGAVLVKRLEGVLAPKTAVVSPLLSGTLRPFHDSRGLGQQGVQSWSREVRNPLVVAAVPRTSR